MDTSPDKAQAVILRIRLCVHHPDYGPRIASQLSWTSNAVDARPDVQLLSGQYSSQGDNTRIEYLRAREATSISRHRFPSWIGLGSMTYLLVVPFRPIPVRWAKLVCLVDSGAIVLACNGNEHYNRKPYSGMIENET